MRARLSSASVKSFVAHVAGVAAGVVCAAAAVFTLGVFAPAAFGVAATASLYLATAAVGAKVGDVMYHWAHGNQAAVRGLPLKTHMRMHFDHQLG